MTTPKEPTRVTFLQSVEGRIFVSGCCMLILWVETIALLSYHNVQHWFAILQMGFAHLLAGRAAGILKGASAGLPPLLVTLASIYMDVMVMFILYPLLIFSYRNFIERKFFIRHMKPVFDSAQKHVTRFRRFKIASVFFFVWFPFWMTGIVVGAVLGYLLGLRTWVNMTTVTLGAASAIVCWVYASAMLFDRLRGLHETVPTILTLAIIAALIVLRVVKRRRELAEHAANSDKP